MDRHTEDRGAPGPGTPIDDASEALTMAPDAGGAPPLSGDARDGLLVPGQRFGPYEIQRLLGRGGMGEVYEAEETASGRRVALKLFNRPIDNPAERERFLREGQLAASISHPSGVYILGVLFDH
jgi:serine/threonine protein kinase